MKLARATVSYLVAAQALQQIQMRLARGIYVSSLITQLYLRRLFILFWLPSPPGAPGEGPNGHVRLKIGDFGRFRRGSGGA